MGLRGGGGNFGIVTNFTFELQPLGSTVLAGMVVWPMDDARLVLRFLREFLADALDEVGIMANLSWLPEDVGEADRHIEWVRRFFDALEPYSRGVYVNFISDDAGDRIRVATPTSSGSGSLRQGQVRPHQLLPHERQHPAQVSAGAGRAIQVLTPGVML